MCMGCKDGCKPVLLLLRSFYRLFVYLSKNTGLDMTRDNIETLEEFIETCKNIVEENTHIRGFVLYELGNNTTAWFRSKQFPISESGYNPCSHKMKRTSYIMY